MIKYIIDNTSSKHDMYGNSYHFARIVSTKTGKRFTTRTDAPCNIRNLVNKALDLEWSDTYTIEKEVPIRTFKVLSKNMPYLCKTEEIKEALMEIDSEEGKV